jgi:CrcB protein
MVHTLLVGVGGMIGSLFRYWLAGAVQRSVQDSLPLGTLVVNVLGCFAIGAFWAIFESRHWISLEVRLFVTVGILGGFTTFSAFGWDTFALLRKGDYLLAMANIGGNVILSTAAVIAGWAALRAIAA